MTATVMKIDAQMQLFEQVTTSVGDVAPGNEGE
jgi:hypothetical protein